MLVPFASQDAGQFAPGDLDRPMFNGQLSFGQADVEVLLPGDAGFVLQPLAIDPDPIGHLEQFFSGVGHHVTHHHATVPIPGVIDVDTHDLYSDSFKNIDILVFALVSFANSVSNNFLESTTNWTQIHQRRRVFPVSINCLAS